MSGTCLHCLWHTLTRRKFGPEVPKWLHGLFRPHTFMQWTEAAYLRHPVKHVLPESAEVPWQDE